MRLKYFVIMLCTLASSISPASFDESARRYLSGSEIIQALSMFVVLPYECNRIDKQNSALLGVDSPLTGNPISAAPTQATIQWIMKCANAGAAQFSNTSDEVIRNKLKELIGYEAYNTLSTPVKDGPQINEASLLWLNLRGTWSVLNSEIKTQIIAHMVTSFLGSDEVIRDFGIIDPNELRAKLEQWPTKNPDLTVLQVIQFLAVNLAVRDEFLSY